MATKETGTASAARLDGKGAPYVEQEIGEIDLPGGQKVKARIRTVLHVQIRPDRWVEAQMGEETAKLVSEKLSGLKVG
jgi:hypothetical protein